jgi:hypothetical protein
MQKKQQQQQKQQKNATYFDNILQLKRDIKSFELNIFENFRNVIKLFCPPR